MKKHLGFIFCFAVFLIISPYMIVSSHARQLVFFPAFNECRSQSIATGEGITCEIRTDKVQYTNGESILICFTVANKGSDPAVMNFSSGQQIDFWAESAWGEVWRASKHAMYVQSLTSIELQPGEVEEFQEEWTQINDEGDPVSPCVYRITGQLMDNGIQYIDKTSVLITDSPCPNSGD